MITGASVSTRSLTSRGNYANAIRNTSKLLPSTREAIQTGCAVQRSPPTA